MGQNALLIGAESWLRAFRDGTTEAEIAAIRADDRYTQSYKDRMIKARQEARIQAVEVPLIQAFEEAQATFEKIKVERRELLTERQMGDPLVNVNMRQEAVDRLRQLRDGSEKFGDFEASYEGSLDAGDVYLTRAFQTVGAELAVERWPSEPAVGRFRSRMSKAYTDYFLGDRAEEFDQRLQTLHEGVRKWVMNSRTFWREAGNGGAAILSGQPSSGVASAFEELNGQIAKERGFGGMDGGLYIPVGVEPALSVGG